VVPGLLRRFRRARPDVRAQLHVMNSGSVEECVRARHCDVGFLGWPPGSPRLRTIEVGQDEVVLVCPPGHRFAGRGEIDLGELAGEALVLREPGSGTRKAVEAALAARGLQLPPHRPAAEVGSGRAVLAAVAGGQGVGFVSSLVAGQAGVRIRGLPMRRSLLLVYHPQHVSPAARAFIAFVTGAPAVI
jgi:DNA-binding transcriptional LysR family regulator